MVVWDHNNYIAEAEKQLNNKSVYKNVIFKEKILQDLAETSNNIFKSLRGKGKITEKQLKYFTIAHKKAMNLGKMYVLPKIHKRLQCSRQTSYIELWLAYKKGFGVSE